ncbi:MAG: hypothetical protein A2W31_05395 [Planctomycetes bacterium RBG_16_64_10]|nr:MAG: hypothetical protein A2W31_05395 [Planctomycetes bacterium RBG_16_64_10]
MDPFVFKLPDLGEGVVEGEIVAWHVRPGDLVDEDQPLLDVMTDKATVTIPSVVAGRIVRTQGCVGQMVPVGGDLVELDPTPATALTGRRPSPYCAAGRVAPHPPDNRPEPATVAGPGLDRQAPRPLASPAVRRRAREKGVDLQLVTGTGHGGRITDRDIEAFFNRQSADSDTAPRAPRTGTTEVAVTGLRRRIAHKMAVSYAQIPHFTYLEQVDITELAALRRHLNEQRPDNEPKITYLPFVMLALARTLRRHPQANAHYDDCREVITQFEAVHLGIATQTERGLYVPVVRHVEAMDLWQATRELQRITQATHHNTIGRDELTGSTFTVSSLGVMGGLGATPIINHPEVAILGIHKAMDQAVVRNDRLVVRHVVNLSASFDHRVIDGADGAAMIQTLKAYLEYPATIFL